MMTLTYAMALAQELVTQLTPYVDKIAVGGSIRRKKESVKDIEVILIPKSEPIFDLFGVETGKQRSSYFIKLVSDWEKVKGDPTGKYTQRIYKGATIDLFMVEEACFGSQFLIRTGDADFSQLMMMRVLQCGYEQKDGYLWKDGKVIPVYEERQYFQLLNLPYIEPEYRDKDAFKNLKQL